MNHTIPVGCIIDGAYGRSDTKVAEVLSIILIELQHENNSEISPAGNWLKETSIDGMAELIQDLTDYLQKYCPKDHTLYWEAGDLICLHTNQLEG